MKYKYTKFDLAAVILAAAFVWGPLLAGAVSSPQRQARSAAASQPSANEHSETYWPTNIQAYSAIAMLILVGGQICIAAGQLRISKSQNDILERQITLQERQHIFQNRPKLIVHGARGLQRTVTGEPKCEFQVVNVGGSDAYPILCRWYSEILDRTKVPQAVTLQYPEPRMTMPEFLQGISYPDTFLNDLGKKPIPPHHVIALSRKIPHDEQRSVEKKLWELKHRWDDGKPTDEKWVLRGQIVYTDKYGNYYRTIFWREFNFTTARFVPIDDPEYENEY